MYLKITFLLFLNLIITNLVFSQKINENIDLKTLELFQQKKYKEVITTGEELISKGTDYFFLRLRVAISYFELKKFRMASFHLEKAMKFNSDDQFCLEYLYYSYLFSGRVQDAYILLNSFPDFLKERVGQNVKFLNNISLETGVVLSNNISKNNSIDIDGENNYLGILDMTNNIYYNHLGLGHYISPYLNIYHGVSNLNIEKELILSINNKKTIADYKISQWDYYINLNFQIFRGIKISPALHLLGAEYDTKKVVSNENNNRLIIKDTSLNFKNYVVFLGITKEFKLLQLNVNASYSNLNSNIQKQFGVSMTYYPLANLNLYLNSSLTLLIHNHGNNSGNAGNGNSNIEKRLVYKQLIGFKLLDKLWNEYDISLGNIENYNENNAYIVYNIVDLVKYRIGTAFIFSLNKKFNISLRYNFFRKESAYINYENKNTNNEFSTSYQNNSIIGGITWNL